MSEVIFVRGLIAKKPNAGAPSYVKCNLSIKRDELIAFLQVQEGEWLNAVVKESKGGKWYIALDTWKKNQKAQSANASDKTRETTPQEATESVMDEDVIEYPSEENIDLDS